MTAKTTIKIDDFLAQIKAAPRDFNYEYLGDETDGNWNTFLPGGWVCNTVVLEDVGTINYKQTWQDPGEEDCGKGWCHKNPDDEQHEMGLRIELLPGVVVVDNAGTPIKDLAKNYHCQLGEVLADFDMTPIIARIEGNKAKKKS